MSALLTNRVVTKNQVIRDYFPLKILKKDSVIAESANGSGKRPVTRLVSLVQKADVPNENGRIYPLDVITESIKAMQPSIKERMVLGELDHPEDAKIHTENAAILLTKLWMEGKNVYGQFEILEGMPKGQMVKALIEQDVRVCISSRGVGDLESYLNEDGNEFNKVLPGFKFVTFDAVNEPSVNGTQLNVMESKIRVARDKSRAELEKQFLAETKLTFRN
jgi:hypothetical protein